MSKAYFLFGLLALSGLSSLVVLRVYAVEDKPKASKERFFEMRTYIAAPGSWTP